MRKYIFRVSMLTVVLLLLAAAPFPTGRQQMRAEEAVRPNDPSVAAHSEPQEEPEDRRLTAPTLEAFQKPGAVTLRWSEVTGASGYYVFRTAADGREELLYRGSQRVYTDAGEAMAQPYTYRVAGFVYDDGRPGAASQECRAAPLLTVPADVQAVCAGAAVQVSWQAVAGAQSYELLRAAPGEPDLPLASTAQTLWTDDTAVPGVQYAYQVRACLGQSAGEASQAVSGRALDPARPMIALTFDDGPEPGVTDLVLNTLERYGVKATFFLQGYRVELYPDLVRREQALAMQIGNHTYEHPQLTKLDDAAIAEQLARTDAVIAAVTGETPVLVRPPYGAHDARVDGLIDRPLFRWSLDTRDWETLNSQKTLEAVLNRVRDGDIVLMHDVHMPTAQAVEQLIPALLERGYQMVTVTELMSARGIAPEAGVVYRCAR
ncbi:MAG: polysaccharide deacetylase family protein [Eubacteriales bacterium]|nr:polysaccharide deacetylase family protein [Eubacteriales bacterium]